MIFGAYLTVQPWSLDFDAKSSVIAKVVAWVRIPGLSFRYYHKSTLRAIGSLLGEVVKMDYMTETKGRGKYARLAVLMDLQKPLVPWILVDGNRHGVEYEGLPLICFECGLYGHPKERCKKRDLTMNADSNPVKSGSGQASACKTPDCSKEATVESSPESLSSPYGSWMQEDSKADPTEVARIETGLHAQVYRKKEVLVGPSGGVAQNPSMSKSQSDGLANHATMGVLSEKHSRPPAGSSPSIVDSRVGGCV
ncbi:hypothetical protein K1719_024309 [Acacia pycnantha]|nr:hypothetical protein K1719_024309 [Acacia pycnantha]